MPVYNVMCRICLTEDVEDTEAMQPLFERNARCKEIVQQIEECGGIVLKAHEEFPKLICLQCLDSLNTSHKFRQMCQASEHALLDVTDKYTLPANSHNDLRTEFIDAHKIDLADITENQDDRTHEFFGDTDYESSNYNNDDDDEEFIMKEEHIADEDDEHELVTIKQEFASKPQNRRINVKHCLPVKQCKTPAGKCERSGDEIKLGRRRKKRKVEPANIMCEMCGNTYAKRGLLNMHMRRHLADKPFQCEICDKKFACPSELGRHMRVHTGEKPYTCRFCGRTFADRGANIVHERIHTNERPFSCTTCGKSFTYSSVLKNHMLTHTGEKPFPCIPCNKTFSRKHQLDQHLGTITHRQTVKDLDACA